MGKCRLQEVTQQYIPVSNYYDYYDGFMKNPGPLMVYGRFISEELCIKIVTYLEDHQSQINQYGIVNKARAILRELASEDAAPAEPALCEEEK